MPPAAAKPKCRPRRRRGFTLVELLVVVMIVILVSAVTLPTVIPAIQSRQVSEAARAVQAALAGARDSAIRANAPRGIRLLPDPVLQGAGVLACNRILSIETAPDHSDGLVTFPALPFNTALGLYYTITPSFPGGVPPRYPIINTNNTPTWTSYPPYPAAPTAVTAPPLPPTPPAGILMVMQSVFTNVPIFNGSTKTPNTYWPSSGPIPAPPTNWFWNIRIGDKFRFNDSGSYYTVIGPLTVANPENFVNDGPPQGVLTTGYGNPSSTLTASYPAWNGAAITARPEYLFLVNGVDDNGNGLVDEGMDGIDSNLDGYIDDITEFTASVTPGYNPEVETWLGTQALQASQPVPPVIPYTIVRRPVASPGAREQSLPSACVIDLTTWDTTRERSRLPNPSYGAVDILMDPSGAVVPTTLFSSPAAFPMNGAFFHFWIADRTDVYPPVDSLGTFPELPMPAGAFGYPPGAGKPGLQNMLLRRERHLVTLYTRTGHVVTNSIENFDATNVNRPYFEAQLGIREDKQ